MRGWVGSALRAPCGSAMNALNKFLHTHMISGVLLVVAGGLGLSFRRPIANFKHSIDAHWNVDFGTADSYRYGVAVLSGAIMIGGLMLVGQRVLMGS